jgi:hypothetical protein
MADAHRGLPARPLPGQIAVEEVVQAPPPRAAQPQAAPQATPAQRGTIMNSRDPRDAPSRAADD